MGLPTLDCPDWAMLILKNLLGVILIIVGILMLVLPGQGIITILVGLMLLNFPGKRKLVLNLIRRTGALGSINRLRARFGKPPLTLSDGREEADEKTAIMGM